MSHESPFVRRAFDVCFHVACLALGILLAFVVRREGPVLAAVYFAAARLGYLLTVGLWLRRQAGRLGTETADAGERRYAVFHRWAIRLQNADAVAFCTLAVATRNTLTAAPDALLIGFGAVLIVVGLGTKAWAVRALGADAYTWHDFFVPKVDFVPCRSGPYAFCDDPMYTFGYLHAHGFALVCLSWPGLAAAVASQLLILAFAALVERPHFRKLNAVAAPEPAPR